MTASNALFEENHDIFRESVRRFIQKHVTPYHEEWEKEGVVPRDFWLEAGAAGILCPDLPTQYGGPGGDFRHNVVVVEEMMKVGASGPGISVHSDIVSPYILNYGTESQKNAWLPGMCEGRLISAVAMTEPGAGSDLQSVKTTAKYQDHEIILNGQKTFITNGQSADIVIVVAKTESQHGAKGISLIVCESDREGFKRGRNLDKIGLKAQDTSELFFDNVKIPKENLLGGKNKGFYHLMDELPQERLSIAVAAVSAAEAALDWTIQYVKERNAFGKKIIDFQNTKFKLAELKTQLSVARIYIDECINKHLRGDLDAVQGAMAKLWTTDLQCKVIDECVQLHGGYGYMREYPIAKAYEDARVQRIYGGTNEIMKEIISRTL